MSRRLQLRDANQGEGDSSALEVYSGQGGGGSKELVKGASLSKERRKALKSAFRRLSVSIWRIEQPSEHSQKSYVASNGSNLIFTAWDNLIAAIRDVCSEGVTVPDSFLKQLQEYHTNFMRIIKAQIESLDPQADDRDAVRDYFTRMMNRFDFAATHLLRILSSSASPKEIFDLLSMMIEKGEEMRLKQVAMVYSVEKEQGLWGTQSKPASPVICIKDRSSSTLALTDQAAQESVVPLGGQRESAVMVVHYDPGCLAKAQQEQQHSPQSIFSAHGSFERDAFRLRNGISSYLQSPYRDRPDVLERFLDSVLSDFKVIVGHFYISDEVLGQAAGDLAKKNIRSLATDSLIRFAREVSQYITGEDATESLKDKLHELVSLMQVVGIKIQLHQEITDSREQIRVACLEDERGVTASREASTHLATQEGDAAGVQVMDPQEEDDSAVVVEVMDLDEEDDDLDGMPSLGDVAVEDIVAEPVSELVIGVTSARRVEPELTLEAAAAGILAGATNNSFASVSDKQALVTETLSDLPLVSAAAQLDPLKSTYQKKPGSLRHSFAWGGGTFAATSTVLAAVFVPMGFYATTFSQFLGSFPGGVGGFVGILAAVALVAGCVAGAIASRQKPVKKGSCQFLRQRRDHGTESDQPLNPDS